MEASKRGWMSVCEEDAGTPAVEDRWEETTEESVCMGLVGVMREERSSARERKWAWVNARAAWIPCQNS